MKKAELKALIREVIEEGITVDRDGEQMVTVDLRDIVSLLKREYTDRVIVENDKVFVKINGQDEYKLRDDILEVISSSIIVPF